MMSIKDLSLDHPQTQILQACTGKDLLKNDRISDMPDDILVRILSSLTLKEAGGTSVLSKRWKHVWASLPSLDFDSSKMKKLFKHIGWFSAKPITLEEEAKYVRWVNQVVSSHKAGTIDEFRVWLLYIQSTKKKPDLKENIGTRMPGLKENIDNWLRFAMERRVKRLELNIEQLFNHPSFLYPYPCLNPSIMLTYIEFAYIDLTGEVLEKFLHDCHNLEFLSVTCSPSLKQLKVVGCRNLKSLKLCQCFCMEHMEVSAPNLIYFSYGGSQLSSPPIKHAPKLAEVEITSIYAIDVIQDLSHLSSYISTLEVLTLAPTNFKTPFKHTAVFPRAPRLKVLTIKYSNKTADDGFFVMLSSVMKSCPVLQKFVLETSYWEMTGTIMSLEPCPHEHLKTIEMIRFYGDGLKSRFVKYLIESAISLEKITIRTQSKEGGAKEREREVAEGFRKLINPGTVLEIDPLVTY